MKRKFFIFIITLLSVFSLTSCSNNTSSSNLKNTEIQTKKYSPPKTPRKTTANKVQQYRPNNKQTTTISKYELEKIKKDAIFYNKKLCPSSAELILALEHKNYDILAIVQALNELDIDYSENARIRYNKLLDYKPYLTHAEVRNILLGDGFTMDEVDNMHNPNKPKKAKKPEIEEPKYRQIKVKEDYELKKQIVKEFNEIYKQFGLKAKVYDLYGFSFMITCEGETEEQLLIKDIFIKRANKVPLESLEVEYYMNVRKSIKDFFKNQAEDHKIAFSVRVENPVRPNESMFRVHIYEDGEIFTN